MRTGSAHRNGARIVGDIGGTNARLATVAGGVTELESVRVLACEDYPRLQDALESYLEMVDIDTVAQLCLAVAGPVDGDEVHLPNSGWHFRQSELQDVLGAPLTVINDFTAQALAIEHLTDDQLTWIGTPRPREGEIVAVVGPGTGLGVAVRVRSGEIVPSEAGHVGFAPTNERELEILRLLLPRYGRVSVERVLSGPGLENLYWAAQVLDGDADPGSAPAVPAREVAHLAAAGDPQAARSVQDFFDILAAFTGDLALADWAAGGIYLSGGVLRHLMDFFDPARFRARFQNKGRFSAFCERVPVAWISADYPGLVGCASALESDFGTDQPPS